jgi:formylglycine-generating enzyme required for sulfatase activity
MNARWVGLVAVVSACVGLERPRANGRDAGTTESEVASCTTRCDGICVELQTNTSHCGSCGNRCPLPPPGARSVCVAGRCENMIACPPGLGDCDGVVGNGCETTIATSVQHCGACGQPCNSDGGTATCSAGVCQIVCQADAGFGQCDANPRNGCENLQTNRSHCGRCGNACQAGQVCEAGACVPVQRSCRGLIAAGCGVVPITGGTFTLGTTTSCGDGGVAANCGINASPPIANVTVDDFVMDAYEVTVGRFWVFWNSMGSSAAIEPEGANSANYCTWGPHGPAASMPPLYPNHPLNCVYMSAAHAFCEWDGGRLPTEAEWEYAARWRPVPGLGSDRLYPWGAAPPAAGVHLCGSMCPAVGGRPGRLAVVGTMQGNVSGGLFDLAGNVAEWTRDDFRSYDPTGAPSTCPRSGDVRNPVCVLGTGANSAVVRGGPVLWFGPTPGSFRTTSREGFPPSGGSFDNRERVGFRCVRAPAP